MNKISMKKNPDLKDLNPPPQADLGSANPLTTTTPEERRKRDRQKITWKREAQPPNQPVLPSTTTTPASPIHHRINQFRASTESRKSKERRESKKQMRRREKFSEEMRGERKNLEEITCEMGGVRTEEIDFLIFTKCTVAFQK
jgi:hypothetical protein